MMRQCHVSRVQIQKSSDTQDKIKEKTLKYKELTQVLIIGLNQDCLLLEEIQ